MSTQPQTLPSVDQITLVPVPRRASAPQPKAMPAAEDGLTVIESSAADRGMQGALFDRCFGRSGGVDAVRWRYDRCPHGGTIAPIAFEDGRLVASYACSPRRVLYRGELLSPAVGQTGDVMTDPDLRSRGVFTALHWRAIAAARHAGWPAVWGLPNEHSGRIFFGKLGWLLAGHIGPWNFVLAADRNGRRERLVNGRLAAYGAPWAAWRGAAARRRLRVSSLELQPVARFPEDVGALSAAVAPRFDWMVQRDKVYLDWRFMDAPSGLFRAFVLRDTTGALGAYTVVQLPREGSAVGFIADLVGVDAGAEGAALDAALAALARAGASVARAYAMQGSAWERLLDRGGFRRPRGYKPVGAYALDGDHALAVATMHTSRWYFTDGDRDDETAR
jgi:GNAT superfamily N-acetyltransferase